MQQSTVFGNQPSLVSARYIVARASAALPAAGAFDASPIILPCSDFSFVTFYISYTRGGIGGAVTLKPLASPLSDTLASFYQLSAVDVGTLVAGSDLVHIIQRQAVKYTTGGAPAELFTYGPIELRGTVERLQVPCAESGAAGTPGTCAVLALFG